MTVKELADEIIIKMLNYRDKECIDIYDFCDNNNIPFSSKIEKERIFIYLNDKGYINAQFYRDGDGDFSITSKGIKYAKELLARRNIISTNISNYYHESRNRRSDITSPSYTTLENNKKIIDNNVEACFDVEYLAKCYVKLIDRACDHRQNNVCLFGIFAPWGRGKSYFFKKVKEHINSRQNSEAIQYDIVEFNAWKYQETPAIWAYLFETLYNSKSWWFKFLYTIKRNLNSIACDFFIYFIPIVLTALATLLIKKETNSDYTSIGIGIASTLSSIGLLLNFISKHYNSALYLIKKYSKNISFARELGIQAEIEKEITFLLEFWIDKKNFILKFFIRKRIRSILKLLIYLRRMYITRILSGKKKRCCNRKVILYIDDIDRCSETKMTSIIDSLRTVLENAEIRKRLIIICSIDPEKIIKGIEYKYKTLYDEKQIRSIAIDQMDKIFLTGMALPPLDNEQLLEFASKLAEVKDISINNNGQEALVAENKDKIIKEFQVRKRRYLSDLEFVDTEIYYQLKNLIMDNTKQLTPRKIRIIYYRILLANNIIYRKENPMITKALIKNIFNLSVGNKIEKSDKDDELTDILNMVVPYRYNEENEVSSESEERTVS